MIVALSFFCLLSSSLVGAVSTDEIDAYINQVLKARNACGPTSVWYVLRRMGYPVNLAEIWGEASIEDKGVRVSDLLALFQAHGVSATALHGERARLDTLPIPSILIIDDQHCIVYEGFDSENNTVRYYEPAMGRIRTVPREEVQRHWSGDAIVFQSPLLSLRSFGAVAFIGFIGILGAASILQRLWFRVRPLAAPSATSGVVQS